MSNTFSLLTRRQFFTATTVIAATLVFPSSKATAEPRRFAEGEMFVQDGCLYRRYYSPDGSPCSFRMWVRELAQYQLPYEYLDEETGETSFVDPMDSYLMRWDLAYQTTSGDYVQYGIDSTVHEHPNKWDPARLAEQIRLPALEALARVTRDPTKRVASIEPGPFRCLIIPPGVSWGKLV